MWQLLVVVWVTVSVIISVGSANSYVSSYQLNDRKESAAIFFLSWLWPVAVILFVVLMLYSMLADLQKPDPYEHDGGEWREFQQHSDYYR